jgi:hypothetical protein
VSLRTERTIELGAHIRRPTPPPPPFLNLKSSKRKQSREACEIQMNWGQVVSMQGNAMSLRIEHRLSPLYQYRCCVVLCCVISVIIITANHRRVQNLRRCWYKRLRERESLFIFYLVYPVPDGSSLAYVAYLLGYDESCVVQYRETKKYASIHIIYIGICLYKICIHTLRH